MSALRQIAHIDRIVCYLYLFVYHCPYKTFPVWKVDLFFMSKGNVMLLMAFINTTFILS
jgi:hypothetical protein